MDGARGRAGIRRGRQPAACRRTCQLRAVILPDVVLVLAGAEQAVRVVGQEDVVAADVCAGGLDLEDRVAAVVVAVICVRTGGDCADVDEGCLAASDGQSGGDEDILRQHV